MPIDNRTRTATQTEFGSGRRPSQASIQHPIPPPNQQKRPSPGLDPVARMRVSAFAKWMMLFALMLFVAWLPPFLKATNNPNYPMAAQAAGVFFAAVLAAAIPRILFPDLFGRWYEAVEALRDWLIVALTTCILYFVALKLVYAFNIHALIDPINNAKGIDHRLWIQYRLPLLIPGAIIGVCAARILAIRGGGILGSGFGIVLLQVLAQVVLLGAAARPFEIGFWSLSEPKDLAFLKAAPLLLGTGAIVCAVCALSIITWAFAADSRLLALQRQGFADQSGVGVGKGPVELTLTVIGGKQAGKTVLLAAAYYEWRTQNIGRLEIRSAPRQAPPNYPQNYTGRGLDKAVQDMYLRKDLPEGAYGNTDPSLEQSLHIPNTTGTDLDKVAQELYTRNEWPIGTVVCQDLPFELLLEGEVVARFNFLDFPGGVVSGHAPDPAAIQEFWERVDRSDALIMIADMSYVRLYKREEDFFGVYAGYMEAMNRLIYRNGRNRVVPVALVLTKCDEFVNPQLGGIDFAALDRGLQDFDYKKLEEHWRRLSMDAGPGFVEFTTWVTSAITYSLPQRGPNGEFDYSKPYQIAPAPPIMPTGCASPLLWTAAKVMRWNVTMFRDLSSFLFGSSPRVRKHIEAMLELERIADERAA